MTKPNIVVLDGFALNPGDLSWSPLEKLGNLTVYPRTPSEQVIDRAQNAQIVLTNKSVLEAEHIAQLPQLKFISVLATGVNTVNVDFARQQEIVVSNVAGYSTYSVAQHVFALLLELTNRVGHHARQVSDGSWSQSPDWSYWDFPIKELKDKTLGVIGLGNIGKQVARIGAAFGMKLMSTNRGAALDDETFSIERVPLQRLIADSHVISLNCPLNDETHHMINRERLQSMKREALLINTARGPLICEEDLAWALKNKIISGAALDVLNEEPPRGHHTLFGVPNCLITPHQAWGSLESRKRLMNETGLNVKAFLEGTPRNVVNG